MDNFFYNLNDKLNAIRATPEVTHKQLNERDEGKPGKNFAKIAKDAGERYGSKAAGERVAGAVKAKMAKAGKLEEQQVDEKIETFRSNNSGKMVNTVKTGYFANPAERDSYARDVKALRASGGLKKDSSGQRSGVAPSGRKIEIDNFEEGMMDTVKKVGKRVAGGINRLVGHGSDEDMRKDVQRKAGVPQTGKKPAVAPMHPSDEYDYFTGRDKVRGGEQQVKEKMSPAKQKSFAALAPPTDKITFADKIAGAKKEVDEMLGDVAAEAMRSALGGGKGRNAEMDEEKSKGTAFDMSTPRAVSPKVGSVERGHKHDITHSTSDPRYKGRTVIRRTDAQGISVGSENDDEGNKKEKRTKAGRPDGTGKKIGAKGPSGNSKLMTREGADQGQAQQVVDDLAELRAAAKQAQRGGEFPQGFASRLEVVLYAAMTLIKNQQPGDAQVREEEKTSTRDDHAEKAGKKVAKDIEYDEKDKDNIHGKKRGPEDAKAEKAGKKVTKDIEHDEKKKDKKEEEVDESTTSGAVATSTAAPKSGGMGFGKGIYDSMNRELENMIAESMSINMSDSTEGGKSLTITATDEDALKLGMMLKNAGLGGGDQHGGDMHSPGEEACDTCGMQDCGCGDIEQAVDENAPDWPTNTEKAENNFGYSGGLNKPKTDVAGDGQTTIPNTAVHTQDEDALRRMMEMAGLAQANLTPGKHTMQAMGPEMSYSDSDPEKIKYDNWLRKASDKDLWDEASKYESAPDYIGREFEKLVAQQKELLGPAAYREKGINDRLKSKLKKYPNMSAPMKEDAVADADAAEDAADEAEDSEVQEDFLESIQRMREIAGIKEAKKPDFPDLDKDGDKKEPMSKAIKDKEEKKVDESIFALTNQWKAYKG